jgi:hypothetical protein
VEHKDRVAAPQKIMSTGMFIQKPPLLVFPSADNLEDIRRHTGRSSGCDPPPSCVASSLAPGDTYSSQGWRLLASAVPWRCFPVVHRQLQHPRHIAYPSVPFFAIKVSQTPPKPPCRESSFKYLVTKEHIGLAEREILVLVYRYYDFPKPSVHGFPTYVNPADRSCMYFVYLHGYKRPPHGGRGKCRRACERTPLRGCRRCAAGGRYPRSTLPCDPWPQLQRQR